MLLYNIINLFVIFKQDRNNKIYIRIYYEDLKYTWINQQPKIELFGLISNIGGSLSLFVGISFISFLELFEVFTELFYIYFIY
jgi:hypothetical protein